MEYQFTLLGISLACAASILVLLRKSLLHPLHAAWWLVGAGIMLVVGLFPRALDVGHAFGGTSPLTRILSIAVLVMLIRILLADLEHCKMLMQQRRMNQHLAWLDLRVRQLEEGKTLGLCAMEEGKSVPVAKKYE